MFKIAHVVFSSLLLISHFWFTLRGIHLIKNGLTPTKLDKLSKSGSHLLLPLAVFSGVALLLRKQELSFLAGVHSIAGILPLGGIFFYQFIRKRFKNRPWLMPVINAVLISIAFLSGLMYMLLKSFQ